MYVRIFDKNLQSIEFLLCRISNWEGKNTLVVKSCQDNFYPVLQAFQFPIQLRDYTEVKYKLVFFLLKGIKSSSLGLLGSH
jgi:hypothetical protein